MAFQFEFDSTNRILRCRFSGQVADEELIAFYRMAVLLVGSLDPLAGIIDFSAVAVFEATPQKIQELAAFPPAMPKPDRPRVIVAPSDSVFGMMRMFGIEAEATRPNLHVVRSAKEGWAILGLKEPEFNSIAEAHELRNSD